jgi:hypothetical protein
LPARGLAKRSVKLVICARDEVMTLGGKISVPRLTQVAARGAGLSPRLTGALLHVSSAG